MPYRRESYIDPNTIRGRAVSRPRKADPIDHSYYIQADGDIRTSHNPRTIETPVRFRATCDVCPWLGPWHEGRAEGPVAADEDGHRHRTENRGAPGWGHCPKCSRRTADDALCDEHATAYEDSLTDEKDPWA